MYVLKMELYIDYLILPYMQSFLVYYSLKAYNLSMNEDLYKNVMKIELAMIKIFTNN